MAGDELFNLAVNQWAGLARGPGMLSEAWRKGRPEGNEACGRRCEQQEARLGNPDACRLPRGERPLASLKSAVASYVRLYLRC